MQMENWTLVGLSILMKLKLLMFHQKCEHAVIIDHNFSLK